MSTNFVVDFFVFFFLKFVEEKNEIVDPNSDDPSPPRLSAPFSLPPTATLARLTGQQQPGS